MNFKTTVVHSTSSSAWNVVNKALGKKFKICIVPYVQGSSSEANENEKKKALEHAIFISLCFNSFDQPNDLSGLNMMTIDEFTQKVMSSLLAQSLPGQ